MVLDLIVILSYGVKSVKIAANRDTLGYRSTGGIANLNEKLAATPPPRGATVASRL